MPQRESQSVLVTGSSGSIGRLVAETLMTAGHRVRGFDRIACAGLDDQVVGDITDVAAVRRAVAGVHQVVHLAAHPTTANFVEVLVPSNVIGVYQVVMSAIEAGVRRLILASSIQVIGWGTGDGQRPIGVDYAAPNKDYALTKLWTEELGRMVARKYSVDVIVARLGWMVRNASEADKVRADPYGQATYLAPSDAARFFRCAVEAEALVLQDHYATLYAVSKGTAAYPRLVDLEPSRRIIGYEPRVRWPDEAPRK